jgi:hypothetical protein
MSGEAEALRVFERRLIPLRTTAGSEERFHQWAAATLPESMDERAQAPVHQGWDAGYSAAMDAVRQLLAQCQTEALRNSPLGGPGVAEA